MAGAVVALMLLTGCQGGGNPSAGPASDEATASAPASAAPTTADASPSGPATPKPSPASSLGPAANLPVPVKPALADENSKEGLEAFTEYWFELFSYGYATNDWSHFDEVTDPGCRTCRKYVEIVRGIYENGQYIQGGEFIVEDFGTDYVVNTQGSVQAYVTNGQADITFYERDGTLIRTDEAPDQVVDVIFATYVAGGWVLLDYGKPEGT